MDVDVSFARPDGTVVLVHAFRVVPGGDGRALDRGHAKRFKYRVDIGPPPPGASVSAQVKGVVWADP